MSRSRTPSAPKTRDLRSQKKRCDRIGINLGDVIEDNDLYGDGVDVAARLKSLADAGGIMVSETVPDLSRRAPGPRL